jgi:hypothetical protein
LDDITEGVKDEVAGEAAEDEEDDDEAADCCRENDLARDDIRK